MSKVVHFRLEENGIRVLSPIRIVKNLLIYSLLPLLKKTNIKLGVKINFRIIFIYLFIY